MAHWIPKRWGPATIPRWVHLNGIQRAHRSEYPMASCLEHSKARYLAHQSEIQSANYWADPKAWYLAPKKELHLDLPMTIYSASCWEIPTDLPMQE